MCALLCALWENGPRCGFGACGFGGGGCAPDCPEFLYQLQLAAEQEAEQEARAAFWRLWKSPVVLLT